MYLNGSNIIGSDLSDQLYGNQKDNYINGMNGNDFILGYEGI